MKYYLATKMTNVKLHTTMGIKLTNDFKIQSVSQDTMYRMIQFFNYESEKH